MKWSPAVLERIAAADDLHVSPFRDDGVTPGTPTWIWSVVVDADLFVRAYNGASSRWHQAALRQRAGQIRAASATHDVVFEPINDAVLQDRIDAAYRAKYATSPYLRSMIGPRARSATMRITPRQP